MENLFIFLISFTIIFLILLGNYFIKKSKKELHNSKEIDLLTSRFKLNSKKLNYNSLGLIFALVNSLIISATGVICTMIDLDYIWQLVIGFVLLMSLIYIIYGIIGSILKRKETKNGKHK